MSVSRYADCMSQQIAVRIPDDLVRALDHLVDGTRFETRADVVRAALEAFVDEEKRRVIGERIVQGYRRVPQDEDEFPELREAAIRSIREEPW